MDLRSKREEIIELVNELFGYTDLRQWNELLKEVFKEEVLFRYVFIGDRRT